MSMYFSFTDLKSLLLALLKETGACWSASSLAAELDCNRMLLRQVLDHLTETGEITGFYRFDSTFGGALVLYCDSSLVCSIVPLHERRN